MHEILNTCWTNDLLALHVATTKGYLPLNKCLSKFKRILKRYYGDYAEVTKDECIKLYFQLKRYFRYLVRRSLKYCDNANDATIIISHYNSLISKVSPISYN